MKNQKHTEWLRGELPLLVDEGVITADAADALRARYGLSATASEHSGGAGLNLGLILFSVLGSAMVGFGIILLMAHNWAELGRGARTVLSFAPLVTGQALLGWVLVRRTGSVAWHEGSAGFVAISVGAAIALIGQTYHIPGDPTSFLMTWALLILPLVYLAGATLPALMYWVMIICWSGVVRSDHEYPLAFWPLAALLAPHYASALRRDRFGARANLLGWAFALGLTVATGVTLEKTLPGLWIVVYSGLFACMVLVDGLWFGRGDRRRTGRPLRITGGTGLVILSLMLSFEWPWRGIGWHYWRGETGFLSTGPLTDSALAAGLPLAAIVLLVTSRRRGRMAADAAVGLAPVVAVVAYALAGLGERPVIGVVIYNVYLLAVAVALLARGVSAGEPGTANKGMAVMAALAAVRFFDADMPFMVKGVAFVFVGAGFLGANVVLARATGRSRSEGKPAAGTGAEEEAP